MPVAASASPFAIQVASRPKVGSLALFARQRADRLAGVERQHLVGRDLILADARRR